MFRIVLFACLAALLAITNVPLTAGAHDVALLTSNELLLRDNAFDDDDVVAVAEPVYYAPAATTYVVQQPAYVTPVTDTVVTPYGYAPMVVNGVYSGYAYSPQYSSFNPYYAAAAYGNGDPVTAGIVSAVIAAAANGGNLSSGNALQALISGFLGAATQPSPYFAPAPVTQVIRVYQAPQYAPAPVQVVNPVIVPWRVRHVERVERPRFVRVDNGFRDHGEGHGEFKHHGRHDGD